LAAAFFANRPAATITLGLLVFVQLVMAAMTTDPCVSTSLPLRWAVPLPTASGIVTVAARCNAAASSA
jgi:hypothetical protein